MFVGRICSSTFNVEAVFASAKRNSVHTWKLKGLDKCDILYNRFFSKHRQSILFISAESMKALKSSKVQLNEKPFRENFNLPLYTSEMKDIKMEYNYYNYFSI